MNAKKWQALYEEKQEWIMLDSCVICDLIAYVLLVNCAPPRIAYALANDNPKLRQTSEFLWQLP